MESSKMYIWQIDKLNIGLCQFLVFNVCDLPTGDRQQSSAPRPLRSCRGLPPLSSAKGTLRLANPDVICSLSRVRTH